MPTESQSARAAHQQRSDGEVADVEHHLASLLLSLNQAAAFNSLSPGMHLLPGGARSDHLGASVPRMSTLAPPCDDTQLESLDLDANRPAQKRLKPITRRPKVRQHVNPLSSAYQHPADLSSTWIEDNFERPTLPIVIDIGCALGTWALQYATENRDVNVLGLEIRRPLVETALARRDKAELRNLHYISSNANVDLKRILTDLKALEVPIDLIVIQFPDPHFKKRNHKRRLVNEDFVATIASLVPSGTSIFFQSDVEDVQVHNNEAFGNSTFFSPGSGYDPNNMRANPKPFELDSEREIGVMQNNEPVYRMLYTRINTETQISSEEADEVGTQISSKDADDEKLQLFAKLLQATENKEESVKASENKEESSGETLKPWQRLALINEQLKLAGMRPHTPILAVNGIETDDELAMCSTCGAIGRRVFRKLAEECQGHPGSGGKAALADLESGWLPGSKRKIRAEGKQYDSQSPASGL
mmetsp:Transcript_142868/g.249168  ORF Transcript_142868/g.249168 Transcript_142868/m.249168 type:complete len:475 (+) Transcript_142868:2-1426(+)